MSRQIDLDTRQPWSQRLAPGRSLRVDCRAGTAWLTGGGADHADRILHAGDSAVFRGPALVVGEALGRATARLALSGDGCTAPIGAQAPCELTLQEDPDEDAEVPAPTLPVHAHATAAHAQWRRHALPCSA